MHDLYREIILDHYKHPRNFGTLKNPSVSHEKDNPLCGDEIRMDMVIENDKVVDIKFSGQGCALSMASASLLTEEVRGMEIKDLLEVSKDDIVNLMGIEPTPVRTKCVVLSLEVIHSAINLYENEKKSTTS